jgi:hypothetical protein
LNLQDNQKELDCHHNPISGLRKRCMDQALMVINQKVNGFNKTSHTCSSSVEGGCIILIIIVTQLVVHISEAEFNPG